MTFVEALLGSKLAFMGRRWPCPTDGAIPYTTPTIVRLAVKASDVARCGSVMNIDVIRHPVMIAHRQ
jgi:hypothetical protein